MTLGERILAARKEKNLSQEQLGEALGVSRQAISKWESNKANPDITYIIQLAKILGTSTDYLLTGKASPEASSAKKASLVLPVVLIGTGLAFLCLIPLLAHFYQGYEMMVWGQAFTNARDYLLHPPLLFLWPIGFLPMGIGGVLLYKYRNQKY